MTRAYPDYYLSDAQRGLGAMLDYAVCQCGEPLDEFYSRFLSSGIAAKLSVASPKYLGMSGVELALLVAELTGGPLLFTDPLVFPGSPEYWTGWALAYVSWYLNIDLVSLDRRGVSAERIRGLYNPYHEADLSKTADFVMRCLEDSEQVENPLHRQRKLAGLTQQQLADMSGHSLRAVRAWEQGQRLLKNAGADGVRRLCQVLGCRMEDLLEWGR